MNTKTISLAGRYLSALRIRLKGSLRASLRPADWLGRQAMARGLETLDLAQVHEQALLALIPTDGPSALRDVRIKQAGAFFLEVLTPIEKTRQATLEANGHLKRVNETLSQRTVELTASNKSLKKEVAQRRAAEMALKQSELSHRLLLQEARLMQRQMRHLSHKILLAQEEERKDISRELHDEITQTLAGINVHLATLKESSALNGSGLNIKIAATQRLVEKSIKIVHQFARDLRPTALDDLGLIPALQSYVGEFVKRAGVLVELTVSPDVEQLPEDKRTVLYRVTHAALTNVARHARASLVGVDIRRFSGGVELKVTDDGKSFQVARVLSSRTNKRLGILGMRERVEMVGGHFLVTSAPGQGTTIQAQIPFVWKTP